MEPSEVETQKNGKKSSQPAEPRTKTLSNKTLKKQATPKGKLNVKGKNRDVKVNPGGSNKDRKKNMSAGVKKLLQAEITGRKTRD